MGILIYGGIMSLDGYVEDASGSFDWSVPDEEVHAFVNDFERQIGTYLYGRRIYEVMVAWESMPLEGEPPVIRDYAEIWRASEKIVYSTTLADVASSSTRIERRFEPSAVARLKATADLDLGIGGPELAAHAIRAGLVDEYRMFVSPVIVGGGKRFFPVGALLDLEQVEERRFGNGVVYLRYRASSVRSSDAGRPTSSRR